MKEPHQFTVIFTKDEYEPGIVNASVPALPGCRSYGVGKRQAMERIREAIECCLEDMDNNDETIPQELHLELVERSICCRQSQLPGSSSQVDQDGKRR